jgi:hypothetical protein
MNSTPPPLVPVDQPRSKFPVLALVLAFLPAALVLVIGTTSGQNGPPALVLWSTAAVSVVCCFISSFMLIRRKAVWAIVLGIVFLLLNMVISFFVGCVAVLKGMKLFG